MYLKTKQLAVYFLLFTSLSLQALDSSLNNYEILENKTDYPLLNPTLKDRKTAKIRFNSGLEAYLVSDPSVDQSAAAVCMQAGSWQDPDEYPGMAHFLEHMLFMGNAAYPEEFAYMQYIRDNGGNVNAFTASDRTVYMFSVNNEAFVGALDRFSHFFIDPLFDPSCINRELHAVDQEHSKNIENDFWREYMVLKETGTPGHPHTKFSTGNADTLSGIPQQALKSWYETHYSANRLHLVMLSSLPLEEMIALANEKFSLVAEKSVEITPPFSGSLLSDKQKSHFIYIKPIKDLRKLSIIFEVPQEFTSIDEKWTVELVSYILTEGSPTSLIANLKKEEIAESIQAGLERYSENESLFKIDIRLTEKGLLQIDTAILRVYETLARIKQSGIPLSLFQEIQTISKIQYQYQSKEDPFEWITDVAYNMADENLESFPEKTAIPSSFNPDALLRFSSALTPESAVYVVLAPPEKLGIDTPYEEKWMGVSYGIRAIPAAKIALWQHAAPYASMGIAPSNPFVPTNLNLESCVSEKTTPQKIINEEKLSLYFAPDTEYQVPEAALLFTLKTPALDGSARAFVFEDIFAKALYEELYSTLFFAEKAGLSSSFFAKELGFSLNITGYSQKAPELTQELFLAIKQLKLKEDRFALYKDSLLSSYANGALELPVKQAMGTLSNVLLNDAPTPQEKYEALNQISFTEAESFVKNFMSSIYIEGLVYGNLTEEKVKDLGKILLQIISSSSPYKERKKQEILLLPNDKGPFKIFQTTERQGNGAVLLIEEGPHSFSRKASQQILSIALQEAFFDTLRTKQQTGYIAQSWASEIENQLLQTFAVQSSSHSPDNLLIRFDVFLEDFSKRLQEILPKERFLHLKEVQITSLEMPPENLYTKAIALQSEAFLRQGDFSWKQKEIEALRALTYEDLIHNAQEFLSKNNLKRLAVLVKGKSQMPAFEYEKIAKEEILQVGTLQ